MGLLANLARRNKPKPTDGDMSVIEHLDELRTRIIISIVAWGLCSGAVWYLTPQFLDLIVHALPPGVDIHVQGLQEAFMTYLKLAVIGGGFLASPVILWQLLLFVLPALTPKEKKPLVAIVPFGFILFVLGIGFSLFLVLPTAARFLMSFTGTQLKPMLMAKEYLGFVTSLSLMCGVVFQMPLIMLFLSFIGIVSVQLLTTYRRFAYFGCFALSAIMSPTPDAFTMIIVAIPMVLLYEISIILVRIFNKPQPEAPSTEA